MHCIGGHTLVFVVLVAVLIILFLFKTIPYLIILVFKCQHSEYELTCVESERELSNESLSVVLNTTQAKMFR